MTRNQVEGRLQGRSSDFSTFLLIVLLEAGGKAENEAALRKDSKAEGTDLYLALERK